MHKAIFRSFTLLLITALAVLLVTACGRTASETPVSPSNGETAFYETNTTSIEMTEAITGESMEGEETSAETQETGAAVYQVPPSDEKGGEISVSAPSNKTTTATDKTTAQTTKKTTTQTSKTPEITAPSTRPATTATTSAPLSPSGYQQEVLRLVNIEREKAGKRPLSADTNLTKAAQVRAKEIADTFSHSRPDGRDCFTAMKEAGVSYRAAGENIAMGQKTPVQVVEGWMNSDGTDRIF